MGFMQQFQQNPQQMGLATQMSTLRQLLQGDNAAALNSLLQNNPNFAQFVAQHKGQSVADAYRSYGYDLNEIMGLINGNS